MIIDKIQHRFMVKTLQNVYIEEKCLNKIRPYIKNPQE